MSEEDPRTKDIPEDLGLEMGTPLVSEYQKIKIAQELAIKNSEINKKVAEWLIVGLDKWIAEEKEKLKQFGYPNKVWLQNGH